MIDYLIELLYPLSIVLAVVLVLHKQIISRVGAKITYALWLVVPLATVLYSLPMGWITTNKISNSVVSSYIAMPKEALLQGAEIDWLMLVWFGVSLSFLLYWLISHIKAQHALKLETYSGEGFDVSLPKTLAIFQTAHTHSPMLIGLFRQKLVIPEDFSLLYNKEQQQLILQHEICHFDRNDIYWNLCAFIFLALFWFHPLVWLAYFRFRRDQEISCDQTVLARKQTESRINYSKALLVAAETTPPLAFAQLSFKEYGDKEIMFERITHIKHSKKATMKSLAMVSILSVSLLSAVSFAGNIGGGEPGYNKEIGTKLHPVTRIEPKYPKQAAKEGIEGAVVLQFDINPKGGVENVKVIKGMPEGVFDKVSKTALSQWKYNAHNKYHKNLLVQLDYRMGPDSTLDTSGMLEKIKVTH